MSASRLLQIASLLTLPCIASAQEPVLKASRVVGAVTDNNGRPIAAALVVRVAAQPETVSTDSNGRYTVQGLARGIHRFNVMALGYLPSWFEVEFLVDTVAGVTTRLIFAGPVLDTLAVRGERADLNSLDAVGFRERQRDFAATAATFITEEDIANRHANRLGALVNGSRAITVQYIGPVAIVYGRNGCLMSVFVDGHPVRKIFPGPPPGQGAQMAVRHQVRPSVDVSDTPGLDFFDITTVRAVEIYPSAIDTPQRFQDGNCGSIVIWTK